jgi:hypothetical protein
MEATMTDEQQPKPSFTQAIAKKALAPIVASAATAATAYLMRKAAEVWQETIQPKLEEKGGAEAVAREVAEKVSSTLAPASDAVTSKVEQEPKAAVEPKVAGKQKASGGRSASSDGDRNEERRKREQRRRQRRKSLEQSGSS